MVAPDTALTGLVCTDDAELGHAVARLMHASGFTVLGSFQTVDDALGAARQGLPRAIVVDAAVLGVRGLPVLSEFLEAAPTCSVVVVCPFSALTRAAVAEGAAALVDPSDLRPLLAFLEQTRAAAHAGYACTCCATVSSRTPVVFIVEPPSPGHSDEETDLGTLDERSQGALSDGLDGQSRGNQSTKAEEP